MFNLIRILLSHKVIIVDKADAFLFGFAVLEIVLLTISICVLAYDEWKFSKES